MSWFTNFQEVAKGALNTLKDDLKEFGGAIKDDTETLVTNAQTAAPEILNNAEAAIPELAAKSQVLATEVGDHLEQVGTNIETFGKSIFTGTTEIFSQVREAVQMEMETKQKKKTRTKARNLRETATVGKDGKYSRYEAQVSAMQRDSATYCDEPADVEDYNTWLTTFQLASKKATIDELLNDNAFMKELESRIVPLIVDHETFWTRYFYRLSKLQEEAEKREKLVMLASKPDEEEESWDTEEVQDSEEVSVTSEAETSAPAEVTVVAEPANVSLGTIPLETVDLNDTRSATEGGDASSGEDTTPSDIQRVEVADADTSSDASGVASGEGEENWCVVRSPTDGQNPAPVNVEVPLTDNTETTTSADPSPSVPSAPADKKDKESPAKKAEEPPAKNETPKDESAAKIAALLAKSTVADDDDIDEDWGDSWDE
mmetsp:Transcript_28498/g.34629  ORF Transcript_28498/g.34629 Transcript_28498/m.34629 type:complete len:431 (+) Transcript_28498:285-1577(+)|eukprot:CAMPEP_0197851552 /NCGR_PEP_ID=MMETSP1438-20131217/18324_1 /TAXON_ID=1461541 /ORGANISM="Pterosperma sp., Strain CCMP1384" /LENGTH=430 /DNA_ID=CAMNT_0043465185 /DNA_START=275 /DNA_END=1567 /DNA_ORIENTATION=+